MGLGSILSKINSEERSRPVDEKKTKKNPGVRVVKDKKKFRKLSTRRTVQTEFYRLIRAEEASTRRRVGPNRKLVLVDQAKDNVANKILKDLEAERTWKSYKVELPTENDSPEEKPLETPVKREIVEPEKKPSTIKKFGVHTKIFEILDKGEHLTRNLLPQLRYDPRYCKASSSSTFQDTTAKEPSTSHAPQSNSLKSIPSLVQFVALDCEMVEVIAKDSSHPADALARCSIVDSDLTTLLDIYVKPDDPVVDYRTEHSGITEELLFNAVPKSAALEQIFTVLEDKIIVGHTLHIDFKVLEINPQSVKIRDLKTSAILRNRYNDVLRANDTKPCLRLPIKLAKFAKQLLGLTIQDSISGHCSVEDAKAAMQLYLLIRDDWESVKLRQLKIKS